MKFLHYAEVWVICPDLALFRGLHHFWLHEEHGIFSRMCDVKGRKVTEMNVGALGLRTTRTAKILGNLTPVLS